MERTFIYPAIHPADHKLPNDEKKLLECKGLLIDIANPSIKEKRHFECKELIIDIPWEASRCPDQYCIYRVPKRLREVNNMAYTPRVVSIGPFHHRSEELKDMDIQKLLILKNFCNSTWKSIEDLKRIIERREEEIRSYYSETILLSSEGFLNMILLDAIFILELFYRKYEKLMADEKDSGSSKAHYQIDYILSRPCMELGILHDLLLLENQLPFFVLEDLYQLGYPKPEKGALIDLCCGFFCDLYRYIVPYKYIEPKNDEVDHIEPKNDEVDHIDDKRTHFKYLVRRLNDISLKSNQVKHLTDLVRYFFRPPKIEGRKEHHVHLHGTATKLDEVGLKFKKSNSKRDLLQIQFPDNECLERFPCFNLSWLLSCLPCLKSIDCLERSVQRRLEVPPLLLDDKTEGLFRNQMALEQCHYPSKTYICDYIVLLDDLITTKEDVRLLVEKEIIVNELGSSAAVTKLINNLALEIEESGTHYAKLCEDLNTYYKSPWNRLVGILTKTYFSDFFKGTATFVGIILLGFTLWNFQRLITLSARKY
ncbi:hypothetical protein I3760_14G024900 [Carya illinoinensis]|nr:hypothetical protein I3760_14G024900 [Carya illinoinensis]